MERPLEKAKDHYDGTINGTEKVDRIVEILKIIRLNKHITVEELVERMGVSRRSISRDIDKLKREGKIIRIGSNKSGYWEVKS